MRVLAVATWYPHEGAPVQGIFNHRHVKALAARHEVRVVHICLREDFPPRSEIFDGIPVIRVGRDLKRPASIIRTLATVRRYATEADVVHSMAFSAALAIVPLHPFIRSKWIHTEHWSGLAHPEKENALFRALRGMRHALRLPLLVTAVSSAQGRHLRRFTRHGAVRQLFNVLDIPPPDGTIGWHTPLRLVTVGALTSRKRPVLAIQTLRWLRENGVEAELTFLGDGPLAAAVHEAARRYGLEDAVFIHGSVEPHTVTDYLNDSDLCLMTTSHETFCLAAAESVAAGIPVVIKRMAVLDDFLDNGNSVQVSGDDPAEYGSAVLEVMERMEGAGRASLGCRIREKASPESVESAFTDLYREITGR